MADLTDSENEENTKELGKIVEAFDDLGYTLEDSKVVEILRTLCEVYKVNQSRLSREYLIFAMKKKYHNPNSEVLKEFELEVLKKWNIGDEKLKQNVKQKSLTDFFQPTSGVLPKKRPEIPKNFVYCQHCGASMKHNGARKTHEFNCMENPKRRKLDQCKETKVTTENPDVKIYFQSAQPNVKVDEPTKKML